MNIERLTELAKEAGFCTTVDNKVWVWGRATPEDVTRELSEFARLVEREATYGYITKLAYDTVKAELADVRRRYDDLLQHLASAAALQPPAPIVVEKDVYRKKVSCTYPACDCPRGHVADRPFAAACQAWSRE